jgi:signal transduction histidine kinase
LQIHVVMRMPRWRAAVVAAITDLAMLAVAHRRRRVERQLLAQARDAVRIREHIVSVVSHDLRNPLSAIDIVASLLRQAHPDAESQRQLEVAQRSVRRMKRLLDDMHDASSIEAGKLALTRRLVDPRELVGDAVAAFRATAADKRIAISEACDAGIVVRCDPERIVQVLGHLLGNAIAFSPADATIDVSVSRDRDVEFRVADTGPGISDADMRRVFEPYWSSGRKTTGLGLYICRGIVEAHGGRIWARSRPGEGTEIAFALPAQQ